MLSKPFFYLLFKAGLGALVGISTVRLLNLMSRRKRLIRGLPGPEINDLLMIEGQEAEVQRVSYLYLEGIQLSTDLC